MTTEPKSILIGKPKHFNVEHYLDSVEQMICADEIKFALIMLDNLPGWYRDHYPERAKKMREQVLTQCMTVWEYVNDKSESKEESENWHKADLKDHWKEPHFYPRGPIIMELVKKLNIEGFCANIVELGPYNYWLPVGLDEEGCDFVYTAINVNPHYKCPVTTKTETDKPIKNIFVCLEVIEHLWHEDEIYHYAAKTQFDFDYVFISTPKYTCGGGLPDWNTRQLGHIRTWTPKELRDFCQKHWPDITWTIYDALLMVCVGVK